MANVFLGQGTFQETTIASSTTCDIGALTAYRVNITGTTTITSLGTRAWCWKKIRFSGALTLTYNATTLILPGGASIVTAAGDMCTAFSDGSGNWTITDYVPASVVPVGTTLMEGSWTPTVLGSSVSGTGQTYSTQAGSYEKIGRLVIARFSIVLTGLGTAAGNAIVGGLPFSNANVANNNGIANIAFYITGGMTASNISIGGLIAANTNLIGLYQSSNVSSSALTITQLTASGALYGCCNYHT